MRKVERMMNEAISKDETFSRENTVVQYHEGVSYVYLHGNKIAEVDGEGVKIFDGGWQTNTTKSRLNAILSEFAAGGERVYQKDFEWRVTQGSASVPFRSGMRVF